MRFSFFFCGRRVASWDLPENTPRVSRISMSKFGKEDGKDKRNLFLLRTSYTNVPYVKVPWYNFRIRDHGYVSILVLMVFVAKYRSWMPARIPVESPRKDRSTGRRQFSKESSVAAHFLSRAGSLNIIIRFVIKQREIRIYSGRAIFFTPSNEETHDKIIN